jgi:hypothetical protein
MKIEFVSELGLGIFWDRQKYRLVFLLPLVGIGFSFPKLAALNLSLAQNDIKPLLPFLDKAHYSSATIILNSDSASKKTTLRKLLKGN